MKRWFGLLLVLVGAALVASLIAARMRPSKWERRHATIRVGMTPDEVASIMHGEKPEPRQAPVQIGSFTHRYVPPKSILVRDVLLEVHFGADGRVVRTTVDGAQVQPGNP